MNTKFANLKFPFWRESKGIACTLMESEHLVSCWCWGTQGLTAEVQVLWRGLLRCLGHSVHPEKALSNKVL